MVGGVFAAVGLVMTVSTFDPAVVFTTVLVLVVMAGSVLPWLALGATAHQRRPDLLRTPTSPTNRAEIDPAGSRADARMGHEILLAVTATVGAAARPGRPLAVTLGLSGTLVAVLRLRAS